jgi:hypothetical protein
VFFDCSRVREASRALWADWLSLFNSTSMSNVDEAASDQSLAGVCPPVEVIGESKIRWAGTMEVAGNAWNSPKRKGGFQKASSGSNAKWNDRSAMDSHAKFYKPDGAYRVGSNTTDKQVRFTGPDSFRDADASRFHAERPAEDKRRHVADAGQK